MQLKTIKNNIKTKLEEWLSSIEDENLRGDLRNKLLVSGGSIASMLLGEPVNDYDIYIKDVDTAYRVALYYTRHYQREILVARGDAKESYFENSATGAYKAGAQGAFYRNLHSEQVKLWFHKDIGLKTNNVDEGKNAFVPLFFSPNAISLSDKIQIVLRFTGNSAQIHKSFDYIHATNYFTFEEGLVTNKEALESLLTKQLKYQGSYYPVTSILRSKKFIKRGWNINAGELFKIMFQISCINLQDPDVLEEQLAGVDVAYFMMLVNILRDKLEKEPDFQLTYEYICALIDKIFNEQEEEQL